MKKIIIILVFCIVQLGLGQNNKIIDSLKKEIYKTKNTYPEIKNLYNLSLEYCNYNKGRKVDSLNYIIIDKLKSKFPKDTLIVDTYNLWGISMRDQQRLLESDSIFKIVILEANRIKHRIFENTFSAGRAIALNYFYKGNINTSIKQFDSLDKLTIKFDTTNVRDVKSLKSFFDNYAIVQANTGDLNSALLNFKKALRFNELTLDKKNNNSVLEYIKALNNIGLCYNYLYDSPKALTYYQKALVLAKNNNLIAEISLISNNISGLHLKQNNNDEAIKYAKISLKYDAKPINNAHSNLGVAYLNKGNYIEAKRNLLKYLNYQLSIGRKDKIALAYTNLGYTYMRLTQRDSAFSCFSRALGIYKEIGMKKRLSNIYQGLGNLYFESKKYKKAIDQLKKVEIDLDTIENKNFDHYRNAFIQYQSYKHLKDDKNALIYLEKAFKNIRKLDSIRNFDFTNELETKYQTQQKENEILQLTTENIQKEASLAQSRFTIFGILGALMLIVSLGYFYWNKRKQTHKLALLENSVKSSEAERSRIGKELHDNIAGTLIRLVHDSETAQVQLSHKLLQTYNEVRNLSHQLDNRPMHGELFLDRVLDIIPESTKYHAFKFEITPRHLQLNEPHGTHIFRIIQELIANNLKYANATQTALTIAAKKETLTLIYKDNGVGTVGFKKGNGYKNIEDRLALMEGTLQIEHQKGFLVTITIPYTV